MCFSGQFHASDYQGRKIHFQPANHAAASVTRGIPRATASIDTIGTILYDAYRITLYAQKRRTEPTIFYICVTGTLGFCSYVYLRISILRYRQSVIKSAQALLVF